MIRKIKSLLKKAFLKFRRQLYRPIPKHISTSLSDNQTYPQICIKSSNDYRSFNSFRRNPIYTQILEHVSRAQGKEYLQLISNDSDVLSMIKNFKKNDDYGNPRMYEYPDIGMISPTTLRYIKVLVDLKKYGSRQE